MDNIVLLITTLIGGGAVGVLITQWFSRFKVKAETESIGVKSMIEVNVRMNERLIDLEKRVAMLEFDNFELRKENLSLKHELEVKGK